jgi:hypothetical protein
MHAKANVKLLQFLSSSSMLLFSAFLLVAVPNVHDTVEFIVQEFIEWVGRP